MNHLQCPKRCPLKISGGYGEPSHAFVLCKFGCHCNDCHGNSCWGGYACRLRYAAEIFNKEESDGIIFHVPFIPTNAFMVPYYVMINKIGLYDNVLGIALVYAGVNLPMSFMVIKGYMDTIPGELLESAKIDGATAGQSFWKIILPVSKPGIVTACIFLVINSWNELLLQTC